MTSLKRSRDEISGTTAVTLSSGSALFKSVEELVESGSVDTDDKLKFSGTLKFSEGIKRERTVRPSSYKKFVIGNVIEAVQQPEKSNRVKALSELLVNVPHIADEVNELIHLLRRELKLEQDNDLKVLMIRVLAVLAMNPLIDFDLIIEDILHHGKKKSKKVIVAVLKALTLISTFKPSHNRRFLEYAYTVLAQHRNVLVQCCCIELLSNLAKSTSQQQNEASFDETQKVIAKFLKDNDPRVRKCALNSIQTLHRQGISIDINYVKYDDVIKFLEDDFEEVRIEAIKLLWMLTSRYPSYLVNTAYGQRVRLADDGFSKMCYAASDVAVNVSLLGSIPQVQHQFLLQTFAKEVLAGEHKGKLTLAKGKVTNEEKDVQGKIEDEIIMSEDDINLLESGAVGAFIQGLDDEFMEVRSATVDSICELAMQSDPFARRAVDFLVDAFNDEIDIVRINAINSLRKMADKVELREDQLHTVLAALEDGSRSVRYAVHNLLQYTKMSNVTCLHATIQALLTNLLQRYPRDIESVFMCLKHIGINHPSFSELLRLDPRFVPVEPHHDDLYYIGAAIVLLNAASNNSHMIALLPKYIFKHHRLLKDKFPEFFPNVFQDDAITNQYTLSHETATKDIHNFMRQTFEKLNDVAQIIKTNKLVQAKQLVNAIARNLKQVMVLDNTQLLQSNCTFFLHYLKAINCIIRIKSDIAAYDSLQKESVKLFDIADTMNYQYIGVDFQVNSVLLELRLFAHLVHVVSTSNNSSMLIDNSSSNNNESNHFADQIQSFIRRLEYTKRYCTERFVSLSPQFLFLENAVKDIGSKGAEAIHSNLVHAINNFVPTCLKLKNQLKRSHAVIRYPQSNQEKPAEFQQGLALQIELEVQLLNVQDISNIGLQIKYVGGSSSIIPLHPRDFIPTKPLHFDLQKSVTVAEIKAVPKDVLCVEITVVIAAASGFERPQDVRSDSSGIHYFPISTPLKYYILAKKK